MYFENKPVVRATDGNKLTACRECARSILRELKDLESSDSCPLFIFLPAKTHLEKIIHLTERSKINEAVRQIQLRQQTLALCRLFNCFKQAKPSRLACLRQLTL